MCLLLVLFIFQNQYVPYINLVRFYSLVKLRDYVNVTGGNSYTLIFGEENSLMEAVQVLKLTL